jgi:hypothetical protein
MAVLIEALNVIVKVSVLEARHPGSLDGYIADCPNKTFCCDDRLKRELRDLSIKMDVLLREARGLAAQIPSGSSGSADGQTLPREVAVEGEGLENAVLVDGLKGDRIDEAEGVRALLEAVEPSFVGGAVDPDHPDERRQARAEVANRVATQTPVEQGIGFDEHVRRRHEGSPAVSELLEDLGRLVVRAVGSDHQREDGAGVDEHGAHRNASSRYSS